MEKLYSKQNQTTKIRSFMSRMLLTLSIFMIGLLFSHQASATHVMGSDITYRCIDSFKYEITQKFYRYCSGVGLGNPYITVTCVGGTAGSVTLTGSKGNRAIRDVTPICASEPSRCRNNQSSTGDGVEEHSWTFVVDFNSVALRNFKNCDKLRITSGECCRNSNITTGGANANFFAFAEIDLKKAPCNSSPALTSPPLGLLCCNQPYYFNNGASDTADFDSISYHWAHPLSAWNQNIGYTGTNLAYNHPISAFYPGTLKPPSAFPNGIGTNPTPIGIFLDPESGDIILTPTECGQRTIAVVEMREWRRIPEVKANGDTAMVMAHIGTTRRDIQFVINNCPGNFPPTVKTKFRNVICENEQLCLDIETDDRRYIDPVTGALGKLDTVRLTWNRNIPGATWKIKNDSARLQEAEFCWTPRIGQARDVPYTFTVSARDDACPLNAVSVRAVLITVKPIAQTTPTFTPIGCGRYAFESKLSDGFRGDARFEWDVYDSTGNPIFDRRVASFESRVGTFSNRQFDTMQFRRGGKYIIVHRINSMPDDCPNTYRDTLVVPEMLQMDLALGEDTFACAGIPLELTPFVKNAVPHIFYEWGTIGTRANGNYDYSRVVKDPRDTFNTFTVVLPPQTYDTAVFLKITDSSQCVVYDTVRIFKRNNPAINLPFIPRICTYDSAMVLPTYDTAYFYNRYTDETSIQGSVLNKFWYYGSEIMPFSQNDSVIINRRGNYSLLVQDSAGCYSSVDFELFVNDTVKAFAGYEYTLCFGDQLILDAQGLDTAGNSNTGNYEWFDITNPPDRSLGTQGYLELVASDTQLFRLDLYQTQEGVTCFDDDYIRVNVNQLPVINLDPGPDVCENSGDVLLTFYNISPTMPTATGSWFHRAEPTWVAQNRFIANSAPVGNHFAIFRYTEPTTLCVNEDSIRIRIMARTVVELRERDVCQSIGQIELASGPNAQKIVVRPGNPAVGTQNWKCLECHGNDFNNMLRDIGTPGNPRYVLDVSESAYTIQSATNIDNVILAYEYINPDGCRSWDTTEIRIWKVPVVLFDKSIPLCHNDGMVSLSEITGVNLTDGRWYFLDTAGFRVTNTLGANLGTTVAGTNKRQLLSGDSINTLNSVPLPNLGAIPGRYYLRYEHDASGCFASNDTTIIINPLPIVNITAPNPTNRRYCETFEDVQLAGNPSGAAGVWSSSDPTGLFGNMFSPSRSTVRTDPIKIKYTFTNDAGCVNADSINVIVDPQPTLTVPTDMVFCREQGEASRVIPFEAKVTDVSSVFWNTSQEYQNVVSFVRNNNGLNTDVTIIFDNSRTHVYPMIAFTDGAQANGSVCDDVYGVFTITVHPIPDATIRPEIPAGCNPHTTTMELDITNDIDETTATYDWVLGLGQFSSEMLPNATYFEDGTTDVSLMITSQHGCDTTLTTSVDAYPIPKAMFRPNPDNFTTAALPRFRFNNLSEVSPVLGSYIDVFEWNFGEIDNPAAISSEQHPIHVYPADTGSYDVTLMVETNYGCRDSFNYPVVIGPDLLVFVPNAFTPNLSGPLENEGFRAVISGEKAMEIIIFNRWGELMFKSTDKNQRWDGTFKGQPCQQDVYAYQLQVTSLDDEVKTYTGTITLLR